jgi:hypothetical protein
MAGHLSTRIWNAAVTPAVREAAPVLAHVMKTFGQFIVFMLIGSAILIIAYFLSGEVPWHVLKSAVLILGLVPMCFGFLVVGDMIRLTYAKPVEVVYPTVEAFEDREPI